MEKLIGIVIPDDIKAEIAKFCKQYEPGDAEPYMALVLSDKLQAVKGLDRKVQAFCLSQAPFKTVIGGPSFEHSDERSVLYLNVMMGPLNTVRDKLVKHLHIQTGSFFRAQLVLLSRTDGPGEYLDNMLAKAKETFSKAREFSVTALATYERKDESESFKIDAEYPFTGR